MGEICPLIKVNENNEKARCKFCALDVNHGLYSNLTIAIKPRIALQITTLKP